MKKQKSRKLGSREADYARHVLLKMTTMTTLRNRARNIHYKYAKHDLLKMVDAWKLWSHLLI